MSAFAASWRVAASIPGPSSRPSDERDSDPRLLLMDASILALEIRLARAWPILPAPMMPIVILCSSDAGFDTLRRVEQLLFPLEAGPDIAPMVEQNLSHGRHGD